MANGDERIAYFYFCQQQLLQLAVWYFVRIIEPDAVYRVLQHRNVNVKNCHFTMPKCVSVALAVYFKDFEQLNCNQSYTYVHIFEVRNGYYQSYLHFKLESGTPCNGNLFDVQVHALISSYMQCKISNVLLICVRILFMLIAYSSWKECSIIDNLEGNFCR